MSNTITVSGNIARDDPELKFTPSGNAVATFTLIDKERRKDTAGNWVDGDVSFFNCEAWGKMAEAVAEKLRNRDPVIVTGKMRQRSYEAKDGTKKTVWNLVVSSVGPDLKWGIQDNQGGGGSRSQSSSWNDDAPF